MRSLAREVVYKYLFAKQFNEDTNEVFLESLISEYKLDKQDGDFAKKLAETVIKNYSVFASKIDELAKDYSFNRIYSTVRCALFIGMAEIYAFSEIDVAVSVNEAVKLASKFSTDKSISFINGILAKYAKERVGD